MILGCYLHLPGGEVHYRQIGTVIAELQFDGLPAQSQAKQLMPETDAEYRYLADKLSDIFDYLCHRLGISGAV